MSHRQVPNDKNQLQIIGSLGDCARMPLGDQLEKKCPVQKKLMNISICNFRAIDLQFYIVLFYDFQMIYKRQKYFPSLPYVTPKMSQLNTFYHLIA